MNVINFFLCRARAPSVNLPPLNIPQPQPEEYVPAYDMPEEEGDNVPMPPRRTPTATTTTQYQPMMSDDEVERAIQAEIESRTVLPDPSMEREDRTRRPREEEEGEKEYDSEERPEQGRGKRGRTGGHARSVSFSEERNARGGKRANVLEDYATPKRGSSRALRATGIRGNLIQFLGDESVSKGDLGDYQKNLQEAMREANILLLIEEDVINDGLTAKGWPDTIENRNKLFDEWLHDHANGEEQEFMKIISRGEKTWLPT